jgi:hypothetical protein
VSAESGTTRWWEYYLPRYLMPSIAGAVIVNWLCGYAGDGFRTMLSLPPNNKPLDSTSLILLFLYGNLFCYIASYPVLVFHATRVLDFHNTKWKVQLTDGYLLTTAFVLVTAFIQYVPSECRHIGSYVAAALISSIQLRRLWFSLSHPFRVKEHGDRVNKAYFYSYVLAHRRGIPVVEETQASKPEQNVHQLPSDSDEETEEVTTTRSRTNSWRKEFMDTYRHLREHGNSAFIFLLEIVLAGLAYCIVSKATQHPGRMLAEIGLLFGIWAIPSAFVHLLAQHLERRFSRYDQKLKSEVIHS